MKKIKYSQFLYLLCKKYIVNSLICIMLGIFLWPNFVFASAITEQNILNLTNAERAENNLGELKINPLLTEAANKKGKYIIDSQTFAHNIDGIKFSNWVKDTDYKYSYVGENLAIDFVESENAMNAWLASPTHKKNILNKYYSEIGIAIVNDNFEDQPTTLIVQIFGAPPEEILPINNLINNPSVLETQEIKNISTPISNLSTEQLPVPFVNEQNKSTNSYLEIIFLFVVFLLILSNEFDSIKQKFQTILSRKNRKAKLLPRQTYKLQKHLKNVFLKTKENI